MADRQRGGPLSGQAASFEGISSVNKLSLPDQVFSSLRDALMCGRFAPGQRIPLRSIAAALGTSTMPAREAVNRLVAMEALELLPNRRVSVPILTAEKYKEIATARGIIEPAAAERATPVLSDADLQTLVGMHKKMRTVLKRTDRDGATQDYMALDKAFFFTIYAANQSSVLMSTIASFWIKSGPYLNTILGDNRSISWFKGDPIKPVLNALMARDQQSVRRAVYENIHNAANFILENDKLSEIQPYSSEP